MITPKNPFDIVEVKIACSDGTCAYYINTNGTPTVDDTLDYIIHMYHGNQWGIITIYDTDKKYVVEYKNGKLLGDDLNKLLPISFNTVCAVTGSGGYTRGDYHLYLSEEALRNQRVQKKILYYEK